MAETTSKSLPKVLDPVQLAFIVRVFRSMREWSQEQLADISGLTTRTIQRIEKGEPSSADSRRALARAFEFPDIDVFNNPYAIPTAEELTAEQEKFDRDHLKLDCHPIEGGRDLARLAQQHTMDYSSPGFEMTAEAEAEFASLIDLMRDFRDCSVDMGEVGRLGVCKHFQEHVDKLKALNVSLRYAERPLRLRTAGQIGDAPWETSALYLVAFPLGEEPAQFAVPRKVSLGGT